MKVFNRSSKTAPPRRQSERAIRPVSENTEAFKRGRTITGSISSMIRSANEASADLKSSRVHAHSLHKTRKQLLFALSVTVILLSGVYAAISQFTASPVVRVSPDPSITIGREYEKAIDSYLDANFMQRWRPLLDENRLALHLLEATPEVRSIHVRGSAGFGKTRYDVEFREPIASWKVGGKELFVDTEGIPFEKSYFGSPKMRIADENEMLVHNGGQSVMSKRFMSYIGQVLGMTEQQGYQVHTITIPRGMTRQIHVHLSGVGYYFKFSSDRSAIESVEDMTRTIGWLREKQLSPEYADLRVSGKAFYK